YNTLHLYDLFRERYPDKSLCYSTLRNILISAHLYTTKIKKRRKPRKRFEKEKSGELLQMDTSRHKWIHGIDEYFSLIL
ncbi:MAG: hypothetical protein QMD71_04505, partial [bacterium]|nr:hypothetical protein [bacterium]